MHVKGTKAASDMQVFLEIDFVSHMMSDHVSICIVAAPCLRSVIGIVQLLSSLREVPRSCETEAVCVTLWLSAFLGLA
jgi:hypothetical protein